MAERSDYPKFIAKKMEVNIAFGGLRLKVNCEINRKPIFVRGHFRVVGGRKVYVKPYCRKR